MVVFVYDIKAYVEVGVWLRSFLTFGCSWRWVIRFMVWPVYSKRKGFSNSLNRGTAWYQSRSG